MQPPFPSALLYRPALSPRLTVAIVAAVMVRLLLIPAQGFSFDRLCCDLAMIAVVIAASERRTGAALAAAALASGIAWSGAIMLCFAIGASIQRRTIARALPLATAAGILGMVCACLGRGQTGAEPAIGLWALMPLLPAACPSLAGLLGATALGAAAHYVADLTVRPLFGAQAFSAAFAGMIGAALLMPASVETLIAPLAIAMALPDRRPAGGTALAILAATGGHPVMATLCLMATLALSARPSLRRAANDNRLFRSGYTQPLRSC